MTIDEWIAKYNSRVDVPYSHNQNYNILYEPDKGFCEYLFTEKMFIIRCLCGDARYFKERLENVARQLNIHKGGTWCLRKNIKAYIRLFGFEIYKVEQKDDAPPRFYGRDKKTGKCGVATPVLVLETQGIGYSITWEV